MHTSSNEGLDDDPSIEQLNGRHLSHRIDLGHIPFWLYLQMNIYLLCFHTFGCSKESHTLKKTRMQRVTRAERNKITFGLARDI